MDRNLLYVVLLLVVALVLAGCATPSSSGTEGSSRGGGPTDSADGESGIDYRGEMRTFVVEIARYAREIDPDFIVVPQNGEELLTENGEPDGRLARPYASVIDGQGREDLFYGYRRDDVATPESAVAWMTAFLDRALEAGIVPLVTDYCRTRANVDDSYARNAARGYPSFAADSRDLDTIPAYPPLPPEAGGPVTATLAQVRNFLYLIDPSSFDTAAELVVALDATAYDLVILDAFVDEAPLTRSHVAALQTRPDGSRRLVIAYLSIGEAEEYRWYWRKGWESDPPAFIARENPSWPGNYKVRYWDESWKAIVFGGQDAYLDRVIAAGFDGVYLDIIDAFEFYE